MFRKAPLASSIVSLRTSLSVGLATRSKSESLAFRSAQMISNCLNSESEKPTLCRKLEVSGGRYHLLTLFYCPGSGIATASFSNTLDIPAVEYIAENTSVVCT